MKNLLLLDICIGLIFFTVTPIKAQKKIIKYENVSYEPFVKSVQLYPVTNNPRQEMDPPIVPYQLTESLLLQFDLLMDEYIDVQAKIIHCNSDWTKSVLNDIEFLYDYNNFDLRDFDYSLNAKILYVNYWFNLPKVKRSGNYVIQVYQNDNENDVLFSRRFVAYENLVSIRPNVRISTAVSKRDFNQQIDFDLIHSRLKVSNPYSEFHIVIRQNQRWDNTNEKLKPTAVRREKSLLEYRHFNMENNFKAGNEFRTADLRSFSFKGIFMEDVNSAATPREATVVLGESRKYKPYTVLLKDRNGSFYFNSYESAAEYLDFDYINTKFQLKSPLQLKDSIYVLGAFNDWIKDKYSLMKYEVSSQTYSTNILLKQGIYDYVYWVDTEKGDPYYFQGSFYQTDNDYEIIVYHKSFSNLTDKVVGYLSFSSKF